MNQHNLHSQKTQPASKCIRFISFLLATILLLTCLSACKKEKQPTNEELIENRITTFVTAYNDGDMDTVLSCLDVKTRNAFQAMLNLLGGLAGSATGFNIDLSDLFSLGVSTTSGDFMELEITDITIIDSANATATTMMDLTGAKTQTIYFVMVYENDGWYIHDMTDEQVGDSVNNSNQTGTNISVLEINNIYNENAKIEFKMNDQTYSGVINSKGEIIYYSEENYTWTSIGNGAGFVTTYTDNDKKIYTLFNEDGYKTITVDGDVFDTIIGYGGGMILAYKNTSTITNEEHSYGVLDCNGNWIKSLTAGIKLSHNEVFEYYGDGIFVAKTHHGYNDFSILFDTNNNKLYKLDDCVIRSDKFVDGAIYVNNRGCYFKNTALFNPYDGSYNNQTSLPSYFAFYTDGTFEELSEFTSAHDNLLINTNGEYMHILDKVSNTEKEYTAFSSEMISSVQFDGDFGLVILNGADGKTYFTVIDKECNQKVAPIVCSSAAISDGRIVYKNSDNIYEVIDVNGTTIVSKNQGFTYISNYSGGIAKAENSDGECYIGLDGNPLTIKLK